MIGNTSVALLGGDPIVQEAKKRFDRCAEWEALSRQRFLEDIKFANGDSDNGFQWPSSTLRQRDVDNRPCLTMNVIRQHNLQIVNEGKQNRLSPKVRALGGGATQASAEIIQQLIRHVEVQSRAQNAYDMAREFQVDGGIGWWRLVTDYAAPDSFDQEIFLQEVWDPLSVYMDPDCLGKDCLKARFAFVFDTAVPRDQFEAAYPDFAPAAGTAPLGVTSVGDDWVEQDHVMVCEYFRKVSQRDTLVSFLWQGERTSILKSEMPPQVFRDLVADDLTRTRETFTEQVEWYLIAGEQIVDQTLWAGKHIPLVRLLGRQTVIDGRLDRSGHTRFMKSAQHMYNWNAPLALDTHLPTPIGWTTMEKVKPGDWLLDEKGSPVKVVGESPVFENRKCYRVTFDDGSNIVADAEHKWKVEERGKRTSASWEWNEKIISTADFVPKRHFIWAAEELKLEEMELPLDPYLLGAWLGDGNSDNVAITAHVDDIGEMRKNISSLGYELGDNRFYGENTAGSFTVLGVRQKIIEMNVYKDKHIPAIYLRASREQRLSLLQGLMDTDGCFDSSVNRCIFVNGNLELAQGFMELVRSLGMKAKASITAECAKIFPNGKEYTSKAYARITFAAASSMAVFRLSRKKGNQTRYRSVHARRTKRYGVVSVVEVPTVPVKCISVNSESHLFLAGLGMIPTHNSQQVEYGGTQGKTPWVGPAKAIEELEEYWNTANTENHSYLPYNDVDEDNPDRQIAAPVRTQPPNFAPLYEQGMQTAFNQMMMTSGQWQNQMGMMGNERTGEAIKQRQAQSDTSVYHFEDNFRHALTVTAVQLIDLFPKIYDTKRTLMLQDDADEEYELMIDPTAQQAVQVQMAGQAAAAARVFNPRIGKYDVMPDVGPSIGTKREQTVEAMTLILTQNPGLTGIIGDLLLASMDFDKAQEAAQRLKRMVPPEALGTGASAKEQQLEQLVSMLQTNLAKSLDAHGKDRVRLVGKDQMRDIDAYKAETDRMKALADMLPTDPEGLQAIIEGLVQESLKTSLLPIIEANKDRIEAPAEPAPAPPTAGAEEAPIEGARKAPDGQWYLSDPTRRGRYLRIAPLAQERAPPGSSGGA